MKTLFDILFAIFIFIIYLTGKYMRFIMFLLLIFGSMWLWNKHTVDPEVNAPVVYPANAASAPVVNKPTLTESMAQWLVDHSSAK